MKSFGFLIQKHPEVQSILFEYDTRFQSDDDSFVRYDYNDDDRLEEVYSPLKSSFDVLLIDPPFLSRECFEKVARFVRFIGNSESKCKHIICTGLIVEHKRSIRIKLADLFSRCYTRR